MGAGPSLEWTLDADSTLEPGKKVCRSGSLEKYDLAAFIDAIEEKLRYPVAPVKEGVLKACEVEETGPGEFTVKIILDGAKLDQYGYGKGDGTDRVDMWAHFKLDRQSKCFESRVIVGHPGAWIDEVDPSLKVVAVSRTCIVEGPCLENYIEVVADGSRISDDRATALVEPFFNDVLRSLSDHKVKVYPDRPSLKGGDAKSVVSDAIDEHMDFDTFWANLLQCIKEPPGPVPEIVDTSDAEFEVIVTYPGAQDQSGAKFVTKVQHDKNSGEILTATYGDKGKIQGWVVTVHRDPVRFEAYQEDVMGVRNAGRGQAKSFQMLVSHALSKSSGWFW